MGRGLQSRLPRVALVGRRNVGKSTLLNALYGRRRAITDAYAGLTRDVLEVEIDRGGYHFLLCDTPGLDIDDPDQLEGEAIERARRFIETVDLILFLLEAPAPEAFDHEFLAFVRKTKDHTPVVYAINKVDGSERADDVLPEFYAAGLTDPLPVSAKGRWNLNALLTRLARELPELRRKNQRTPDSEALAPAGAGAQASAAAREADEDSRDYEDHDGDDGGDEETESGYVEAIEYDLDGTSDDDDSGRRVRIVADEAHEESGAEDQAAGSDRVETGEDDHFEAGAEFEYEADVVDEDAGEKADDHPAAKAKAPGSNKRDRRGERRPRARIDKSGRELDAPGLHGLEDSTVISDAAAAETRIAIVGRPNAGKSSLLNRLAGREVSLVSDIPGTTRDTVDTVFEFQERPIRVIDTAGMRRQTKLLASPDKVDYYSVTRTRRAIRDCRVVIHMIDAVAGITDFDKKISAMVKEFGRPVVVAVNKWDAIENKDHKSMDEFTDRMEFLFPHLRNLPIVFCSALVGQRVNKLIEVCLDLDRRMRTRVATGALNSQVEKWMRRAPGSARNLKIFYVSQVDAEPPVFIFFVNKKKTFTGALIAYFENHLRREYNLEGIPLRIFVREKGAEAS
ncbi:MAG: 50S ribosome-binding GTPase [bacterium]|nr:50S ribosome-binding GTPase [bacterium]